MMLNPQKNIPTILVVFGATGDLMAKKIIPALFHLHEERALPSLFRVVGVARRPLSHEDFLQRIEEGVAGNQKAKTRRHFKAFFDLFQYERGDFERAQDYKKLSQALKEIDRTWGVCANKLFYLAVPPALFEGLLLNLASSDLTDPCSPEQGRTPLEINRLPSERGTLQDLPSPSFLQKKSGESLTGWTRVIVEKPFGKDLKTAEALDELLGKLFNEIQIYRIDHYLAKEMLQNILAFRFSNNLFEMNWGNELIEKIHIRLLEKIGVEKRGSFYDGVGAFRDVGQNHLLQMAALVTMDHPAILESEAIRTSRAEILETLVIPSENEIRSSTFRAQYRGYRAIPGVAPDSQTETYFKARARLSSSRWQGVPIILESGKRLKNQIKEIKITFRHPTPCLCPKDKNEHYKNTLTIHLEPKEGITIRFWSKKPGFALEMEERALDFLFRSETKRVQYAEEYEKLLLDCIAGDQTLFTSSREVKAMWKFTDPIVRAWETENVPLASYKPDTDAITAASQRVEETPPSRKIFTMHKEIGMIGLGKMGANMARRLQQKGWSVHGLNKEEEVTRALSSEDILPTYTLEELVKSLSVPRIIWLMIPAGHAIDEALFGKKGLVNYISKGDIIIDGGNSFYKDALLRAKKLQMHGVQFLDVGVSGGPGGARHGASLMVGGSKEIFDELEELFRDLALGDGYGYMGTSGAGHFVKMIHNGIEYGMMQSLAEGFAVLKNAKYKLNLADIARVYNRGSVIESRLVEWLKNAFELHGQGLDDVSGSVAHTGEGEWTIKTAKEMKIKTKIIEEALKFRIQSQKRPDYTGKILSALREQFGGHSVR